MSSNSQRSPGFPSNHLSMGHGEQARGGGGGGHREQGKVLPFTSETPLLQQRRQGWPRMFSFYIKMVNIFSPSEKHFSSCWRMKTNRDDWNLPWGSEEQC